MPSISLRSRKKRVFDSVFGQSSTSQPKSAAASVTGLTAPGQAFKESTTFGHEQHQAPFSHVLDSRDPITSRSGSIHLSDQARWEQSWQTVTHALALPSVPTHPQYLETWKPRLKPVDATCSEALRDLLDPQTRLPSARPTEDIVVWHANEVRRHFLRQVLPVCIRFSRNDRPDILLAKVINLLKAVHYPYLTSLAIILEVLKSINPEAPYGVVKKFRRDLHAVISNSIADHTASALRTVCERHVSVILGLPLEQEPEGYTLLTESHITEKARDDLLSLVELLHTVGLAGERFHITFAEIMNESMAKYVHLGCKGIWSPDDAQEHRRHNDQTQQTTDGRQGSTMPRTPHLASESGCVEGLCEWIENRYARLAVQVYHFDEEDVKDNRLEVTWAQVEKWKEIGVGYLASLRTDELFDIVLNWPHSSGALYDLRTAITTPQRRLHLTDVFTRTLTERLLQPGVSTLQILQAYISLITSFHALDRSKVLLDRVAHPLQLYLCSRDDTVRIIITGLLSETEDSEGNPIKPGGDKLVELALLLNKGEGKLGQRANDEELDWDDMYWLPDPVDAGPRYKRTKTADVIGTLIGVLGSQEVFIKEFQNVIGEQLLKGDGGFEKEIKVLDLLKNRFGEAPLQNCEVMLKDIQDSGRVNSVIRRNQQLEPSIEEIDIAHANFDMQDGSDLVAEGMLKPSLNAKILSRLFWPQLRVESFKVPEEITKLQTLYERGFQSLKAARKLTWVHALGQATVELQLEDRTITEEVHTYQATVIYAFQSDELSGGAGVRRSVSELVQHTEMDEALVRSALRFWASKLVIQEIEKDVYSVLETLNQEDRARSNEQAAASAVAAADDGMDDSALMADEGITADKVQMYWQFIQGMLKNSSSQMPLQQIAMMLKMLIADGFPYSNEELQVFLETKVSEGELELAGGKYRLKK